MNDSERSALVVMRDCWIGGGAAAELAPSEWKGMLSDVPAADRERLSLAIAGQALDVGFRPAAPKALVRRMPLPRLALPTLPEQLRPLFRMALKQAADARGRMRVAALTAARGFVAHPVDWMPSASDLDAPPAYAPWLDWLAQGDGKPARALEQLTIDNWDDFYPAGRRLALADIRRSDPAKARALLEAKAAGEAAEARLALIELLRVNLGADDVPFLQSLSADRSGKVRQLAARLLGRIGQRGTGDEAAAADVAELAGFIEPGKSGWLRRRPAYTPKELKSPAQVQRRAELFESCQLVDLADRLATSEADLIEGWQLGGKGGVDQALAAMVVASGSDAAVSRLGERLRSAGDQASLVVLVPRLGEAARRSCVEVVLAGGRATLGLLAAVDGIAPGTFALDELMRSRLYKELRAAVVGRDGHQAVDLGPLGFLATASAADAIAKDLVAAGLIQADPSLALLRLNAALGNS